MRIDPGSDWPAALARDGYAIVEGAAAADLLDEVGAAVDAKAPGGPALDRGGQIYAMRNLLDEVPAAWVTALPWLAAPAALVVSGGDLNGVTVAATADVPA